MIKAILFALVLLFLNGCSKSASLRVDSENPIEGAQDKTKIPEQRLDNINYPANSAPTEADLSEDSRMRLAIFKRLIPNCLNLPEGYVIFTSLDALETKVFPISMPKFGFESKELSEYAQNWDLRSKVTKRDGVFVDIYLRHGGKSDRAFVSVSPGGGTSTLFEFQMSVTGGVWTVTTAKLIGGTDGFTPARDRKH